MKPILKILFLFAIDWAKAAPTVPWDSGSIKIKLKIIPNHYNNYMGYKLAQTNTLIYNREITLTLVYVYKTYNIGILQNKRELVEVY